MVKFFNPLWRTGARESGGPGLVLDVAGKEGKEAGGKGAVDAEAVKPVLVAAEPRKPFEWGKFRWARGRERERAAERTRCLPRLAPAWQRSNAVQGEGG